MRTEVEILLVGLGGAAGALSRHGVNELVKKMFGGPFPLGTLVANLTGCLMIGVLLGSGHSEKNEHVRLAAGVGFLGAFTTFSTFSAETVGHLNSSNWPIALSNVIANVVLGIALVFVGIMIGKKFV